MSEGKVSYFSKTRVESFSDGIFAVIITLLVLEIKVPQITHASSMPELAKSLLQIVPKILSWIVSFLIVCVIWVNHHQVFEQLKLITHSIFWLNANLLLWCTLIPFITALMGDYITNPVSLFVFGVILSFMAFAFYILRLNIIKNSLVLNENVNLAKYKNATTKSLFLAQCSIWPVLSAV